MSKKFKKIIVVLLLSIIFISNYINIVNASYDISETYIEKIGEAQYHLKYYQEAKGMYTYVICAIVGYYKDGNFYPAYCLNRDLHGVGMVDNYTVDVDSIIDNNQIWRAVKNGYPYKSASEMGLSSEFDAFAVTKFAIYCLTGQSDINLFTADEGDEEGQAMLRALYKLVDIGKNGNDTFNEEVKISKLNNLEEDGNYYSLTLQVNGNSSISEYVIKSLTGVQDGDLLTDENGNIKTTFKSGEKFKIKILKSNLNSNKNINIELTAKLKSYPLFYGKTRIAGTQNYLLTANSYNNIIANTELNLKLNTGKIQINKIDDKTKEGIEGVEFELYNSKKEFVSKSTTDKNGKVVFSNLYQGKYTIKEVKANENYILDENNEYDINVNYNKTSTISIENKRKKGNLEILKVDKDSKNPIENVGFELYNTDKSNLIGTFYTDKDGKIEINELETGNYKIKEVSTNQWYNLSEDKELIINWNEKTTINVEDELKKGQIKIIKVDKENNEIKLKDVKFEIQDVNGNILETIITDENGEAITSKYPLKDFPKLRLHEIQTNEKYELNNEITEIVLEENQIKNVIFENEKIKGNIRIIKTADGESKISGIKNGEPLKNVKFQIYNERGKIIDTVSTNENGIAESKKLEKGKYKIKEIETDEWFLLNENDYSAEIKNNKEIATIEIKNKPANPDEEIEKNGPENAMAGNELEYKIKVANTGNVELDNFIWEDKIPTDYIRVTKIDLGTFNQENTYDLYYKTNLKDEYTLLLEDISTINSEKVDFSEELSKDEYITSIKLDFGKVDVGFQTEKETIIKAKVNSNVKRNDIFENEVVLTSEYKGYKLSKSSSCKTTIYEILPLTGM